MSPEIRRGGWVKVLPKVGPLAGNFSDEGFANFSPFFESPDNCDEGAPSKRG